MKQIRIFSHVDCDSPGYLGDFLKKKDIPYDVTCLDDGIEVADNLEEIAGLVSLGGPGNVNEPTDWMQAELKLLQKAVSQELPVLGICLGAQMLSKALGGVVTPNRTLEVGWHPVISHSSRGWFDDLPARFEVFQWHAHTFSLPPGAVALAHSDCAELQAFASGHHLAMQFHLEMTPESIEDLIVKFASDLEDTSTCVQDATIIIDEIHRRTRNLYQIADVVYDRWLQGVYGQ